MNFINAISKLLCKLGAHGPEWFGNVSSKRSVRIAPFVRECDVCKTMWIGNEISTTNVRTLGGWRKASPELREEMLKEIQKCKS